MLEPMLALTRVRAPLLVLVVAVALTGCGLPPLHRSVAVQTDDSGIPVHASGSITHDHYTVVRGDTLYSIAFRANVDYHQLARWNSIRAPYVIQPGQRLRLSRPARMAAQPTQAPVFQTVTATPRKPAPSHATAATAGAAGHAIKSVAIPAAPVSTAVAVAGQAVVSHPSEPETPAAPVPVGATRNVDGVAWRWPAVGKVLNRFDAANAMPGIDIAGKAGDPVRAAAAGVVVYSGDGLVGFGELVIIKHNDDYLSAYAHNSKRLVSEGEHVTAGQLIARMGSTGASRNELEFEVRYKGKPVDPLKYLPPR